MRCDDEPGPDRGTDRAWADAWFRDDADAREDDRERGRGGSNAYANAAGVGCVRLPRGGELLSYLYGLGQHYSGGYSRCIAETRGTANGGIRRVGTPTSAFAAAVAASASASLSPPAGLFPSLLLGTFEDARERLLQHLFSRACRPYLTMLEAWILRGEVCV